MAATRAMYSCTNMKSLTSIFNLFIKMPMGLTAREVQLCQRKSIQIQYILKICV